MLNNFYLKIIAIILMLIDHIGMILYDKEEFLYLRIIGRASFPIFAFLVSEGYKYTTNINKYFVRLIT